MYPRRLIALLPLINCSIGDLLHDVRRWLVTLDNDDDADDADDVEE